MTDVPTAPARGARPTGDDRPPPPAMPELSHQPTDYVDGPSSPGLLNTMLEYSYTIGNDYRLTFDGDFGVTFQMLNDGSEPRGPMPYLARELRERQYLVHWHVRDYGIHVALVIDLPEQTISVAAMMPPGAWEFFDHAKDVRITRVESTQAS